MVHGLTHDLHAMPKLIHRMKKMDMKATCVFQHLCEMGVKLVSLLLMLLKRRLAHNSLMTQH